MRLLCHETGLDATKGCRNVSVGMDLSRSSDYPHLAKPILLTNLAYPIHPFPTDIPSSPNSFLPTALPAPRLPTSTAHPVPTHTKTTALIDPGPSIPCDRPSHITPTHLTDRS